MTGSLQVQGVLSMSLLDPYSGPWTKAEVAHLTRRTTFGARPDKVGELVTGGVSAAVDSILDYPPEDAALEQQINNLPDSDADLKRIKSPATANDLEGWWLYRFANSNAPMQQQLALFLHDHFVSEYSKTSANVSNSSRFGNDGSVSGQSCNLGAAGLPPDDGRRTRIALRLLRDQHYILLTQGHQNLRDTLIAITRDPCMLIYLDNRLNVKGKPQENYAREIMELFSMGVGNYTEEDVRNVARAFTGETIRVDCKYNWPYTYLFDPNKHDTGNDKKIFGVTLTPSGTTSDDTVKVIDLILARVSKNPAAPAYSVYPATAVYICWKLVNWFVNQNVGLDHPIVGELANYFYNGPFRYNVRELLRKLLKSQYFYDSSNRLNFYKHPVDFVATAWRNLGINDPQYAAKAYSSLRDMGMRLFEPPTVEGWHHGKAWINSSNLIARFNYADRLSSTTVLPNSAIDPLMPMLEGQIIDYFADRLLLEPVTPDERAVFMSMFSRITVSDTQETFRRRFRAALHLTMTMPRYQLK